jgi:predicted transcriptional regulator
LLGIQLGKGIPLGFVFRSETQGD